MVRGITIPGHGPYDADYLRAQMPVVGERLRHVPYLHKSLGLTRARSKPCIVVYVNLANLWYMVEYENGLRECYKMGGHGGG